MPHNSLLYNKKKTENMHRIYLYLIVVIIGSILVFTSFSFGKIDAACGLDKDWPNKPCYDVLPGPSLDVKRKQWEEYYNYKGKDWMEMKKNEIETAIGNGTLEKWLRAGITEGNYTNSNAYAYYFLMGEVTHYESGKYVEQIYLEMEEFYQKLLDDPSISLIRTSENNGKVIDNKIIPPLKQLNFGVLSHEIVCKDGFELILKSSNHNPVCVTLATATKLIERGWASS